MRDGRVLSAETLFLVAGVLHRTLGGSRAHGDARHGGSWQAASWQQAGLVLVPAAWLMINMVPNLMAMAYAYLPHAHRVQSAAVAYALRAQSVLLFFVCAAMVHAAVMHHREHRGARHAEYVIEQQHASAKAAAGASTNLVHVEHQAAAASPTKLAVAVVGHLLLRT